MLTKKRPLFFAFLLAFIALSTVGASCPGCFRNRDCGAFDGKKADCEKDKRCHFVPATGRCTTQAKPLQSGCMDIAEEAPCRASSNCFFDEAARVCLEAPPKNACGTIKNETACNADKNCHWHGDSGICSIKK